MKRTEFKKPDFNVWQEMQATKRFKRAVKLKTPSKSVSKSKKVKLPTLSKLKKNLWELTKQIIRRKYLNDEGYVNCYTCGILIIDKGNMHTAHFIDSSVCGADLRYDFDNLRICCYLCNVHRNGNKIEYYRKMVEEVGQDKVDEIYARSKRSILADRYWYNEKIRNYQLERNIDLIV